MGSMTAEAPEQLAPMSAEEAQDAAGRVRLGLGIAVDAAVALYHRRGWEALGYESWEAFCDAEFGSQIKLPVDERREVVASLRQAGMSHRAVGAVLGTGKSTAHRDSRGVPSGTPDDAEPESVTGTDGKTYQPTGTGWPDPQPEPEPEPAPAEPPGEAEHRQLERAWRVAGEAARTLEAHDPVELVAAAEPNRRSLDNWRKQFDRLRMQAQRYEEAC